MCTEMDDEIRHKRKHEKSRGTGKQCHIQTFRYIHDRVLRPSSIRVEQWIHAFIRRMRTKHETKLGQYTRGHDKKSKTDIIPFPFTTTSPEKIPHHSEVASLLNVKCIQQTPTQETLPALLSVKTGWVPPCSIIISHPIASLII